MTAMNRTGRSCGCASSSRAEARGSGQTELPAGRGMTGQCPGRRRFLALCGAVSGLAAFPAPHRAENRSEAFAGVAEEAERLSQLHALIVVRDGEPVFARAFRGPPLDRPVNVKSVAKTIVALLTGIAIGRGSLAGTGATLGDLVPALIPPGADHRVPDITIADLLTMRAGLERTSGPNYGPWVQSPNWIAHALLRPVVAEPGTRFQYSTGCFHVLGAVLATVTGRSLLELARAWLGEPLGIAIPPWTRDPQGYYMGGNNMALSPPAMTRIGEMLRLGGVWHGSQVVPGDWIEASWRPRTRSPYSGDAYGYGWFLTRLGGEEIAYARGYGGQMLYVCPSLALTIAVTSDPTRPARTGGHVGDLNRLVADRIMQAVRG